MNSLLRFSPLAFLLLLTGCTLVPKPTADPTRHYVLTGPSPATYNANVNQGTLRIGLSTVKVAPYLEGKAMVIRRGDNQIDYQDYQLWAEPIAVGVNRMLAARLVASERVARVFPQPYPFDAERDIDVTVNILRCEGELQSDGRALAKLVCVIELTRAREGAGYGDVLIRENFTATETEWKNGDYAALARQLSAGVAALATRIVEAIPSE